MVKSVNYGSFFNSDNYDFSDEDALLARILTDASEEWRHYIGQQFSDETSRALLHSSRILLTGLILRAFAKQHSKKRIHGDASHDNVIINVAPGQRLRIQLIDFYRAEKFNTRPRNILVGTQWQTNYVNNLKNCPRTRQ